MKVSRGYKGKLLFTSKRKTCLINSRGEREKTPLLDFTNVYSRLSIEKDSEKNLCVKEISGEARRKIAGTSREIRKGLEG